jgi:ubiquinone/menaquinone biosynthesis C-methylase UbiE
MKKKNYVSTIYDIKKKPLSTDYPKNLIDYLCKRFDISEKQKLLEPGLGRGEFLYQFSKKNIDCYGFDFVEFENYFSDFSFDFKIHNCLDNDKLPYPDNFFDVIYSKSFIEHFYYPEKIFKEFHRILRPNGIIISLTPDWETIYKTFYEDFTHRTPFTSQSLRDIHNIFEFKNVHVEKFIQLPSVWNNNLMRYISIISKLLAPSILKKNYKWVKFSKEIMLLSYAQKN